MNAKQVCWAVMAIALAACSGSDKNRLDYSDKNQLGNLPVVAHQVEVDGQEMTVANSIC